jgi:hypothetical protein
MRERVRRRLVAGLPFLAALGVSCSSASGPSVMEEVQYAESHMVFQAPPGLKGIDEAHATLRTLMVDADGNFVARWNYGGLPEVEGRLEPGEHLRVRAACTTPFA